MFQLLKKSECRLKAFLKYSFASFSFFFESSLVPTSINRMLAPSKCLLMHHSSPFGSVTIFFNRFFLKSLTELSISKYFWLLVFITEKFGMRSIVSSTLATQIFVSPLIFYMMGQISLVGIFANILIQNTRAIDHCRDLLLRSHIRFLFLYIYLVD